MTTILTAVPPDRIVLFWGEAVIRAVSMPYRKLVTEDCSQDVALKSASGPAGAAIGARLLIERMGEVMGYSTDGPNSRNTDNTRSRPLI